MKKPVKIKCNIDGIEFDARQGFRVHVRVKHADRMAFVREHVCSQGCAQAVCARAIAAVAATGPAI